ncbi:oligosaccharide flippase family protein [Wenyingzhuangia marina]|uniref:Membrane protein involved in the export of O-antigen and teichoic acid n=1 Tax=Wenyingzhuangia marina TaxID=1195760 RepID=A0A1M5WCF4_9FLAO|nr:oligosaccharide flippase family protein [Wenyingzhuangia marina]GGF81850.1 flippase [Wenyingzhuangia marina]SHH85269.1 Membrane protein involved in the export of O-antigen and teichoic acid [Wenyingzhuangia marina]
MSSKLKINAIYNAFYQIVLFVSPIIVAPYVSRVFGPEGIGAISFSQSIFIFFNLLGSLGSGTYGQRLIASTRNNIEDLTKSFWEIVILKVFLSITSIIIYTTFVFYSNIGYKTLLLVLIVDLSVNMFDIAWLYQGLENFKKTIINQVIIKVLAIVGIFLFVKNSEDTYVYLLCFSIPLLLGYIALWKGVSKNLVKIKIRDLKPFKHLGGLVALFLPFIAILLFSKVDKLMLGFLSDEILEVGYYEQGMKFISIALGFITSFSVVLLPTLTNYFQSKNHKELKDIILKTILRVFGLSILLFLGLFVVSSNFVPWFFGKEFIPSIAIMKILSVLMMFKGINAILGSAYLISIYQQKKYTIAIYTSVILNILLNWLLIPIYFSKGAAYTSVFSEIFLFAMLMYFSKDVINYAVLFKLVWKYILAGIFTILPLGLLANHLDPSILNTIILTISLLLMYGTILIFVFKDEVIITSFKKIVGKFY